MVLKNVKVKKGQELALLYHQWVVNFKQVISSLPVSIYMFSCYVYVCYVYKIFPYLQTVLPIIILDYKIP